ncbi:MAG: hypothetical protein GXO07_05185 [Crenarchaeota archaeon]|nr:hypothetical protein [Thermoproteota archaeon]
MSTDSQRHDTKHAVLVVDPFLRRSLDELTKENAIEGFKGATTLSLTYSTILQGEEDRGLVVLSDAQYLSESVIELKVRGLRKIILLDVATALKPGVKIAKIYPVYASASRACEGVSVPPVPSISLLNRIVELLSPEREVLAFTTRLPYQDVLMIDVIKKKGFDVIDKNSALLYEVCQGKMECVVLDVVDSNLSKGVERDSVWDEGGKYYSSLLSTLAEALNKLLSSKL